MALNVPINAGRGGENDVDEFHVRFFKESPHTALTAHGIMLVKAKCPSAE